jgi:hypothetical protein
MTPEEGVMRSTAFFFFAAIALAGDSDTFLIRNADVYPVTSAVQHGASVLVENGRIAAVGAKAVAGKNVRVIEAKGLRVYPGLVDSSTQLGLSEISGIRETVDIAELGMFMPQLRTIVAVNPESEHFPVIRANGITSAMTFPSSSSGNRIGSADRQIISGQAALIHLDGWTWEDMQVKRSAAMHLIFPTIPARGRGGAAEGFAQAKRNYERKSSSFPVSLISRASTSAPKPRLGRTFESTSSMRRCFRYWKANC